MEALWNIKSLVCQRIFKTGFQQVVLQNYYKFFPFQMRGDGEQLWDVSQSGSEIRVRLV